MKFLVLFCLVGCTSAFIFDSNLDDFWNNYKKSFKKSYKFFESIFRRQTWETNVQRIFQHNLEADLGIHSFRMKINNFSDLTFDEFVKTRTGYKKGHENLKPSTNLFVSAPGASIPNYVDWRREGMVTEVKDQSSCGSCWAFSSTGSLEGQLKKKRGKLISLSEQYLVDCSVKNGCSGAWMEDAFYYVQLYGIPSEADYPYQAKEGPCQGRYNVDMKVTGYTDIPKNDEDALTRAVATVGPISVTIEVIDTFSSYASGIYDDENCTGKSLNHAVTAVGYGTESGKDYWLLKNSWSSGWGDQGYIKIARNKNRCGIAMHATYPNVE